MSFLKLIKKQKNSKFTIGFICRNVGLSHFRNISKIKFIYDYLETEKILKKDKVISYWDYKEMAKDNIICTENMIKAIEFYGKKRN